MGVGLAPKKQLLPPGPLDDPRYSPTVGSQEGGVEETLVEPAHHAILPHDFFEEPCFGFRVSGFGGVGLGSGSGLGLGLGLEFACGSGFGTGVRSEGEKSPPHTLRLTASSRKILNGKSLKLKTFHPENP